MYSQEDMQKKIRGDIDNIYLWVKWNIWTEEHSVSCCDCGGCFGCSTETLLSGKVCIWKLLDFLRNPDHILNSIPKVHNILDSFDLKKEWIYTNKIWNGWQIKQKLDQLFMT